MNMMVNTSELVGYEARNKRTKEYCFKESSIEKISCLVGEQAS